jgi:type II restriction enzyme
LNYLEGLGVTVDEHGKMPDVVIHDVVRDWLVLVEAVTSHDPVNPKRLEELRALFRESRAGLVFVTAFPETATFRRYANDVAWASDVWIRDAPTHLIHFDGERFLGPYD